MSLEITFSLFPIRIFSQNALIFAKAHQKRNVKTPLVCHYGQIEASIGRDLERFLPKPPNELCVIEFLERPNLSILVLIQRSVPIIELLQDFRVWDCCVMVLYSLLVQSRPPKSCLPSLQVQINILLILIVQPLEMRGSIQRNLKYFHRFFFNPTHITFHRKIGNVFFCSPK